MPSYASPSKIKSILASAQAKMDSIKEKNIAIRTQMGLTGRQPARIKPMSDALKAKIAAHKSFGNNK